MFNVYSDTDDNIFIFYRFYRQLFFFTIYFIISFIAFHYRPECMNVTQYRNCGKDKGALNVTNSYDLNESFIDNSYTTSIFTEISGMYYNLYHVGNFHRYLYQKFFNHIREINALVLQFFKFLLQMVWLNSKVLQQLCLGTHCHLTQQILLQVFVGFAQEIRSMKKINVT